jgi:hypothetical protein
MSNPTTKPHGSWQGYIMAAGGIKIKGPTID